MSFNESKIKRADDGRFGSKPGSHEKKKKPNRDEPTHASDDGDEENTHQSDSLKKWADSNAHVKHAVERRDQVRHERDALAREGDAADAAIEAASEEHFGDNVVLKELIANESEWAHRSNELDERLSENLHDSTDDQYDVDASVERVMANVDGLSAVEGRPLARETRQKIENAVRTNIDVVNRQNAWMHAVKSSPKNRPLVEKGSIDLGDDALYKWAKSITR